MTVKIKYCMVALKIWCMNVKDAKDNTSNVSTSRLVLLYILCDHFKNGTLLYALCFMLYFAGSWQSFQFHINTSCIGDA